MSETKFGYMLRDWNLAKEDVIRILADRVRSGKGLTTYGQLANEITAIDVGPGDYAMFHLLGEVSGDEEAVGRGMLSAYVVSQETGYPGNGFFELGRELGYDVSDRDKFWSDQVKIVERAWRK